MLLQIVVEPYQLSEKAQKLFDALARDIESANADSVAIEQDHKEIQATNVSSMTSATVKKAQEIAYKQFDLDRRRLRILERLKGEWIPARNLERVRATNEAFAALESAQADVRTKLQGIGFTEGIPEFAVSSHPAVIAASARYSDLRGLSDFDSWPNVYAQSEKELRTKLEQSRQRLLAV